MKLLIASDIHGDLGNAEKILSFFEKESCDKLLLLGDLLYFGPRNYLTDSYNPKGVIELLNKNKDIILAVRGNCDAEVDQMVLDFPIMADYCYLSLDGLSVFATHGHHQNEDTPPPLTKGDILLCGHTHIPAWRDHGSYLYLNPGSVSIPKEGSAHSYMILEDATFTWKDLDGTPYHTLSVSAEA